MFLLILFFNFYFTCIKASKNSSAKSYKDQKERLKACESYQIFLRKKIDNMNIKYTKISQKMKNSSWLSSEKTIKK